MNVSSQVSAATTQVSGAVAIASASSSKTASLIAESSPDIQIDAVGATATVMFNAEVIGLCSFIVMLLSFVWNVYSTKKRDKLNADMRIKEYELEERKVRLRENDFNGTEDRRKS